jgi:hypothetical protein
MNARRILMLGAVLFVAGTTPWPAGQESTADRPSADEAEPRQALQRRFQDRLRAGLALDESQAAKVLPRLEALEKHRVGYLRQRREAALRLRSKLREDASDADLQAALNRLDGLEDEHCARVRAQMAEIDRHLSVRQRVELRFYAGRFRDDVEGRIRERRPGVRGSAGPVPARGPTERSRSAGEP